MSIKSLLLLIFFACPYEDSTMCVWDAENQGNGEGSSFLALTEEIVIYLP